MAQKKEPTHRFRLGRIKVAIWANQSKKGEAWFNVEIVRSYLEGDAWQESTKFGRDDLPIVAKAADMAYAWIWAQQRSDYTEQADD
jgi:hypothetical protein